MDGEREMSQGKALGERGPGGMGLGGRDRPWGRQI